VQLVVRELMETEAALWDELVAVSPQRTLFAQRWWMEIVTGGGVRLLGCFNGDRLLAGMPIWPCRTLGIPRLRQPPLTPYWGPLLRPLAGKACTQASTGMHLLRALAEALSRWPDIAMQWHHSLTNWLPFYWNGFTQTTRYTYRIADLSNLAALEKARHDSVGQQLRRAVRDGLHHEDMVDPDVVARLHRLSRARQGAPASPDIQRCWPELARAARARDCLFTTAAVDNAGHIHSAMAMVWDDHCAYGIFNGADPQYRHTYGGTLTMWREIEFAASVAPEFDFEGSCVEAVEQFYRRFGGSLCHYMLITRAASRRLNLARALQYALRPRGRPRKSATAASAAEKSAASVG